MFYVSYFLLLFASFYSCNSINNVTTIAPSVLTSNTTYKIGQTSTKLENATTGVIFSEVNGKGNNTVNVTSLSDNNGTEVGVVAEVGEEPRGGLKSYFMEIFKSIKSSIGDNCTMQEDCETRETICLEGICQCQEGYVAAIDKRHCLRKVKAIGEECVQDAQCYAGLNLREGDATCISFRCLCGTGTIHRNGTCLRTIYLGDNCETDDDCLTLNSHCKQGVCACPVDMIPSAESMRCLPALKTLDNSNCTEDEQCQHFMGSSALCTENICHCKQRTHSNGSVCVADLRLGQSCNQASDCISSEEFETKRRDCINQKCACAPGFSEVSHEDICIGGASFTFSRYSVVYTLLLIVIKHIYL